MLGLPQELIDNVRMGKSLTHLKFEPVLLPVKPCEPPVEMVKPAPRFYAKIADQLFDRPDAELSDIEGMSGGPIIGIRQANGQSRYFLVAIQSGWWKDRRIIAGNYSVTLAEWLEQELDAVFDDDANAER